MKALILAAGFGTRLRPFTHHTPKALAPVQEIPLIVYTLAFLKKNDIKEVVINLHHLGHKIRKLLGNGKKLGLKITYSPEEKILGTGGGIKKASKFLGDDFLVINSDVIADFNLKAFIRQHLNRKPMATLTLFKHPEAKKYGLLYYKNKKLLSILKKTPAASHAMFASFHIINKKKIEPHWKKFPAGQMFCIMRDVYIPLASKNGDLEVHLIKGYWSVCDSQNDIHQTEKDFKSKDVRLSYTAELKKIARLLKIK